jgi:hypothetical protein
MSADPAALRAPEPLTAKHDVSRFTNGIHPSLDQWLRQKARASEDLSARTYVVCSTNEPNRVIDTSRFQRQSRSASEAPPWHARAGAAAVDRSPRGQYGVARPRLRIGAPGRCFAASEIAGARGVVAHAIDDAAIAFYKGHGFVRCLLGDWVMLMPIEMVRSLVAGAR